MTNPYPTLLPEDFAMYGVVRKTHGHQGELIVTLNSEALWEVDPECLFPVIDQIAIPYQVEGIRGNSSQLIIKLNGINNLSEAERLIGCHLMILKKELPESYEADILDLVGYSLIHATGEVIGQVLSIDNTTINTLILIKRENTGINITIPLVEDWIIEINEKSHTITLDFPLELLEL